MPGTCVIAIYSDAARMDGKTPFDTHELLMYLPQCPVHNLRQRSAYARVALLPTDVAEKLGVTAASRR